MNFILNALYVLGICFIEHPIVSAIILIVLMFVTSLTVSKFAPQNRKTRKFTELELLALAKSSVKKKETSEGYLIRIQSDFADFHAEDAKNDIQTFIFEFFQIKYEGKECFEKTNVSDKVILNIGKKTNSRIEKLKIDNIIIVDYQKSLNAATIKYHVSVGFTQNDERVHKAYEIEYTLQLKDEFGAHAFLECQNCGAELIEFDGVCQYCGTKNIRDTMLNWVITNVREI